MLLSRGYRYVDIARIAAFAKRLAEVRVAGNCDLPWCISPWKLVRSPAARSQVALHSEPGEAVASLAILRELLCRHTKLRRLLVSPLAAWSLHCALQSLTPFVISSGK